MLQITRHEKIKSLLLENKIVNVSSLSTLLRVSEETIRRDLSVLEKEGFLEKIHGGAVISNRVQTFADNTMLKNIFKKNKQIIAKRARKLINEGDSIYLDSSTTSLQLCEEIKEMRLTILTNSIDILSYLSKYENINLVSTGGQLIHQNRALIGRNAVKFLSNYSFDKCFISPKSIDIVQGATESNDEIVEMNLMALSNSKMKIVLADHSKFYKVSFTKLCPITDVDVIITDEAVSEQWTLYCEEHGIVFIDSDEPIEHKSAQSLNDVSVIEE